MPRPPVAPEHPEIACWRLVPAARATWQAGMLTHDPDLGGWSWEDGVGPEDVADDIPKAYWTPPILDAHTHVGDAFLRPERHRLPRDLVQLVAPPNGYKHKRLRTTDAKTIQQAMHERARAMTERGTTHTLDFREGGLDGLRLLGRAVQKTGLGVTAYTRPATDVTDADPWCEELDELLALPGVGVGLSALSDLPGRLPEAAAELARANHRPLALHLSERIHEDMERALDLGPACLVHLNECTTRELEQMAERHVLAVSCPTSNLFFGLRPPLSRLHEAARDADLQVALGTDNAMLSDGDVKDEARSAIRLAPDATLDWLLRAMTWNGWKALRLGPDPAHPGLLWGIHAKVPPTHPEETALAACQRVFDEAVCLAPRI